MKVKLEIHADGNSHARLLRKVIGSEEGVSYHGESGPKQWQDLLDDTPADLISAALVANAVKVMANHVQEDGKEGGKVKALDKNERELLNLINKLAFGDKIVHEKGEGFFDTPVIKYEVVPDRTDIKESEK